MGIWGKRSFPQWREEEQSSLGRPLGRDQGTAAMTNDYSRACSAASESWQERKRTEEEALLAAPWGEPRELTMSVLDEREASENKQWRKEPACWFLTIGWGSGGSEASSSGGAALLRRLQNLGSRSPGSESRLLGGDQRGAGDPSPAMHACWVHRACSVCPGG